MTHQNDYTGDVPTEEVLRSSFESEIETPLGLVRLQFQNNPMLSVKISRAEPFFEELASRWNECRTEEEDPHETLQSVAENGTCMSPEARKAFTKDFLYAASSAIQQLEQGQETACESLEQHADLI